MANQARFYLTTQEVLASHRNWITTSYCEHHLTEDEIANMLTESVEDITSSQIHNCLISWSIIPSPYTALAAVAAPQQRNYQRHRNDTLGMDSSSLPNLPLATSDVLSPTENQMNTTQKRSVRYIGSPILASTSQPDSLPVVKFLPSTNDRTNEHQSLAIQYPDSPTFPSRLPSSPLNFTNETTISQADLSSARLKVTCHHGPSSNEYHETSTRLSTMPIIPGPSPLETFSTSELERVERLSVLLEQEPVEREHLGIFRREYKRAGESNVRLQAKRIRSRKRRGASKRGRSHRRRGVRGDEKEGEEALEGDE